MNSKPLRCFRIRELAAAAALCCAPVVVAEDPTPAYPRYHDGTARHTRPGTARDLPGSVRSVKRSSGSPVRPQASADRVQARKAAHWAAEAIFDTEGRRELYRLGFFHGLLDGIDVDPGALPRLQGERAGRTDPAVRAAGYREGASRADRVAGAGAERQVERQFLNLAAEPRYRPVPDEPRFAVPEWRPASGGLDSNFEA